MIARLALVAALTLVACGDSGVAPSVMFSISLADGRLCRDAGVALVSISHGGDAAAERWVCYDAEAPHVVMATDLPIGRELDVLGLSPTGTELYRGRIKAEDVLGSADPTTVLLYPDEVR